MQDKPWFHISFSGGRTSAYMTWLLVNNWHDRFRFIVTFANTGLEHPKTLEFVRKCDEHFGFNTTWLEAVTHPLEGVGISHKVVTFETASRNGEPFAAVVAKYGVPNRSHPNCSRDLKHEPTRSFLRSHGIRHRKIPTAIGIRTDESRRVNRRTAEQLQLVYPLIDIWPTDKEDVLAWWSEQSFDLEVEEFEGNCQGCWKKSWSKHFQQIDRDPSVYDFHRRMEQNYRHVKAAHVPRVFFAQHVDTDGLFRMHADWQASGGKLRIAPKEYAAENGGCAEACEFLPVED